MPNKLTKLGEHNRTSNFEKGTLDSRNKPKGYCNLLVDQANISFVSWKLTFQI